MTEIENSYHYRISLRVRHPDFDPELVTTSLGVKPDHSWQAGMPRCTPAGLKLPGVNLDSYWMAHIASGRRPPQDLSEVVDNLLNRLIPQRNFFHKIRIEKGCIELFLGWFFEGQGGSSFPYNVLGLASDLKIDFLFDVYPPSQPQNEFMVLEFLPPSPF